jgi:hypothetical protein
LAIDVEADDLRVVVPFGSSSSAQVALETLQMMPCIAFCWSMSKPTATPKLFRPSSDVAFAFSARLSS